MEKEHLYILIERYAQGMASRKETKELHDWYRANGIGEVEWPVEDNGEPERLNTKMLQRLKAHIAPAKPRSPIYRMQRIAAAAIIVAAAGAAWVMLHPSASSLTKDKPADTAKSAPGNKATLTLADGRSIVLENVKNGMLQETHTAILKQKDGLLVYKAAPDKPAAAIGYNTLTTPRGGQYLLILPDGTNVWLNAASSIRYPVAFTGNERIVELTGEGYFEVAKNKTMPFKIKTSDMMVEVLGTEFNVMAYADEPVEKTTLIGGSVQIVTATENIKLQPGQQASLIRNSQQIKLTNEGIEEAIAWKKGYFLFNKTNSADIFRQITRWYDVEVEFSGKPPADFFSGKIYRNVSLPNLLKVLQTAGVSGIQLSTDGKKIIIH